MSDPNLLFTNMDQQLRRLEQKISDLESDSIVSKTNMNILKIINEQLKEEIKIIKLSKNPENSEEENLLKDVITVKGLIEKLQQFDPDALVLRTSNEIKNVCFFETKYCTDDDIAFCKVNKDETVHGYKEIMNHHPHISTYDFSPFNNRVGPVALKECPLNEEKHDYLTISLN